MNMFIQNKPDYSFLFSSLGNGTANAANNSFLADYASIKNGSYARLLKAYYSETGKESTKTDSSNNSVSQEKKTALTKVQTTTDALKESADALLENGKNSVFAMKDITTKDENGVESTSKGYDMEGIYKAVNSFVNNYNAVIDAVNNSDSEKVVKRTESLVNNTITNSKLLNKVGITINEDSTLSIDKDTFMKANMSTVKTLFNGNNSVAYRASAQASMINLAADREVSKGTTYTNNATYNYNFNTGNLFNTYF